VSSGGVSRLLAPQDGGNARGVRAHAFPLGSRGCIGILLLAPLSGCATTVGNSGYCAPPATVSYPFAPDPSPPDDAPRDAQVAALVGLSGAAKDPVSQPADATLRVLSRVELAGLVIGATSAELHCESERAEQAAEYLSRQQTRGTQWLTVGSVVAAALTGIGGVLLSTRQASEAAQDSTAIGGGIVTAGLGLASLYVHPRTRFDHERNLLADVWSGPTTSPLFPSVVWAYLTRPAFSNSRREAIRGRIVARWKQFEQVEDLASAATLFGRGGSYDVDLLRARAAMLDEVRAEVELEKQDLAAFAAALLH
jgi:hypothetical protein